MSKQDSPSSNSRSAGLSPGMTCLCAQVMPGAPLARARASVREAFGVQG